MHRQQTAVLIPAYNAEDTVAAVVTGAKRLVPDVLVVDDGSCDATASQAESAGAVVVRHSLNRGKGAAIQTGLRHLAARGVERAIALDADGQHLPGEMPKLVAESDLHPDAIVLSVRDKEGQPIALKNRLANWAADRLTNLITGHAFSDTQCGFRVYPIGPTLALGARGDRMEFDTAILIAACRAGMPVREVRTRVYYPPAGERRSHYRQFEDTWRIARVIVAGLLGPRKTSP